MTVIKFLCVARHILIFTTSGPAVFQDWESSGNALDQGSPTCARGLHAALRMFLCGYQTNFEF
jgi:hypothetical protein